MAVVGLTKRQAEVLVFIEQFISAHSHAPSYSDIQHHFGFASVNAVAKHLAALSRRGVLKREPHASRSLSLEKPASLESSGEVMLLLMGYLMAGLPIQTYASIESWPVPASLVVNPSITYLLRVEEHSLHEEMLLDGDLLIIETRL